jgi:ELWxxDGT repeat protein
MRFTRRCRFARVSRLESLETRNLLSLTPELLADIADSPSSSSPQRFTEVGDLTFFTAEEIGYGRELWVTDGTKSGTRRISDIRPGSSSPNFDHLVAFQGELFFTARDVNGAFLYRSDGTAEGTRRVSDDFLDVRDLVAFDDRLIFVNEGEGSHVYLWSIDASLSKAEVLFDDSQGSDLGVVVLGSTLIFHSDQVLWRSDGTKAGTSALVRWAPGSAESLRNVYFAGNVGESASVFYFGVDDRIHGAELWRTDGSIEGTYLVKDINPGAQSSGPHEIVQIGDIVYLVADDGVHGHELMRSDGTPEGTWLVADLAAGMVSSLSTYLTRVGDDLYFFANDKLHGQELWCLRDGAVERLTDMGILPGDGFTPGGVISFADAFFFVQYNESGSRLWRSDGTVEGTNQFIDVRFVTHAFTPRLAVSNGLLWFGAQDAQSGSEAWISDGTVEGTSLFMDLNGTINLFPHSLAILDDKLLFRAHLNVGVVDASESISFPTEGLFANRTGGAALEPLAELDGAVFFGLGNSIVGGYELWRSDGTTQGTKQLAAFASALPGPSAFRRVGDQLFFLMDGGKTLWKTDGSSEGTVLVESLTGAGIDNSLLRPIAAGGMYFYARQNSPTDYDLWRSDGTSNSAVLLGSVRYASQAMLVLDDSLLFIAPDLTFWKSNGTAEGTVQINVSGVTPEKLLGEAAGLLYFVARNQQASSELWVTDGTPEGTQKVAGFGADAVSSDFGQAVPLGDRLVFIADDGIHGRELWITDGSAEGTRLLADALPGGGSLAPQDLTAIADSIFFTGDDGIHGREFWRLSVDGDFGMIADIFPGPKSSLQAGNVFRTAEIVRRGDTLYFPANDGAHGYELWKLTAPLGDTNFDGRVGIVDLNNVRNYFGGTESGDADHDGDVDVADLNAVRNNFGRDADASPATTPSDVVTRTAQAALQPVRIRATVAALLFAIGNCETDSARKKRTSR